MSPFLYYLSPTYNPYFYIPHRGEREALPLAKLCLTLLIFLRPLTLTFHAMAHLLKTLLHLF
jgi:hypothetical protein